MNITGFLVTNWLWLVFAIPVAILGPARLSRVIIFDAFPPAAWLRARWDDLVDEDSSWNKLLHCPWCLTPWLVFLALIWAVIGFFVPWVGVVWWVIWGWLAISYVASIVIAYDEP